MNVEITPRSNFQWIDYVKTAKALRQLFRKRSG